MTIPAEASRKIAELNKEINLNPTQVSRFVLYSGDGHSASNSWQWVDSFKVRLDGVRRNQWFGFTTDATSTKRIYAITVPSNQFSTPPVVGNRVTVTASGTDLGVFRINFVNDMRWIGNIYAYQIICEVAQ